MSPLALIEVVRDPDGAPPGPLLRLLYQASGMGEIVLALRDIEWQDVDAELDSLVPLIPLNIPGIRYIDARDPQAVLNAAATTKLIVAATDEFACLVGAMDAHRRPNPLPRPPGRDFPPDRRVKAPQRLSQ